MATSAAVGPVQRRGGRTAVGPRSTERSADPQASRRPAPGLLRPSRVPVPGRTSQVAGSPGARSGTDLAEIPVHPSGAGRPAMARQPSIGSATVSRMLSQARHAPAAAQRSSVHDVLRGPGQPLPASSREEMEARFGTDFSGVRVHTDAAAQASAAEVGARAYTSGRLLLAVPDNDLDFRDLHHGGTRRRKFRGDRVRGPARVRPATVRARCNPISPDQTMGPASGYSKNGSLRPQIGGGRWAKL